MQGNYLNSLFYKNFFSRKDYFISLVIFLGFYMMMALVGHFSKEPYLQLSLYLISFLGFFMISLRRFPVVFKVKFLSLKLYIVLGLFLIIPIVNTLFLLSLFFENFLSYSQMKGFLTYIGLVESVDFGEYC
ncbi:MAG: hypothetical protein QF441_06200 [Bacteriovoracaceae bacterium]|jgi:predicted membrane channel-forming protein YqfA (hemolysin III family)|nr:hypothetical protein [Bacteriovoracaceae bacterium]|tara:strand:+ start:28 stop:420 length:393 start_codon:yes stop_codon:yes gene_type:complete